MANKFILREKWDGRFFLFVFILVIIGAIMVYSSSYYEIGYKNLSGDQNALFKKEIVFVVVGLVVMWFVSKWDYKLYRKIIVPLNLLTVSLYILLLPVFKLGINFRDSTRWIQLGPIQLMPSDIAKYVSVLTVAYLLTWKKNEPKNWKFYFLLVCPLFYIVATKMQPDLSTTIVITATVIATMYFGGLNIFYILVSGGALVVGAVYIILSDAEKLNRVRVFMDPFLSPQGKGYQIIQSLVAISSGGLKGAGLGLGKQKMLYLPLSYNDYIFSVYAEELGFIGCVFLIFVLSAIIMRGLKIATNAPDKFSTLIVGGIIAQIAIQSIINMYVAVSLIPSTGINFPILSYGGTSLMTTLGALGIILGVSRLENKKKPTAYKSVEEKKYYSLGR